MYPLSASRAPGLRLRLDRLGGTSPPPWVRLGEGASAEDQAWWSRGAPLAMGASLVGMPMPPPFAALLISCDCQAGEERDGW